MDRIGPYKIVDEIGRGGMGVVYRAVDEHIGRPVAVKVIRFDETLDPEEREQLRGRLFREARAAGILKHPGIVTIYYAGEEQGVAFIAMEYVNGPTLEKVLLAGVPIDKERIRQVLRETAAALDYAHKNGIIHRDIKPANIMLEDNETVKICDFGIAKGFTGLASMTQTGTAIGTPHYMPPEQIQGKPVDARADQYALAVIAYQVLTGRRPFQADSIHTLFYRIMAEPPETAHKVNPSLPAAVAAVFDKALAKEPANRYAACREFVEQLLNACDSSPDWSPPPRRGLTGTGLTPPAGGQPSSQPYPTGADLAATPLPAAAAFADRATPPVVAPRPPAVAGPSAPAPAAAPLDAPGFAQSPPSSRKPLYLIGIAALALIAGAVALKVWMPSDHPRQSPAVQAPMMPSPTPEPTPSRQPQPTPKRSPTPRPSATPAVKVQPTPDPMAQTCQALSLTPDKCAASPWAHHCIASGLDPGTCARQLRERRDACLDLGLSLPQCAEKYH